MSSNPRSSIRGALVNESSWVIQRRVIGALLLRELLTRYGRNNIGFFWLFVEPMLFVLVVMAFWTATRDIHGSDLPIAAFALTGYSSVLLWRNMPSRCIGALKSNLSLLHHRQVTIMDIYFSRILLEIMGISISFVTLAVVLSFVELVLPPEDLMQVLSGWMLVAWFGAGLGLTIAGLSEKIEVVGNLWAPFSYILFPLSGAAFIVDALPQKMQEIVLYLPMLNGVEVLREGWFGSAMHAHYDIGYTVLCNIGLTFLGLTLVRQVGVDTSSE